MLLELIDQSDFASFPEESGPRWVTLETLARQRLSKALLRTDSKRSDKQLKMQYMHIVAAAAGELGIQGISVPGGADPTIGLDTFMVSAQAAATKVWLNSSDVGSPSFFPVRDSAKDAIRIHVAHVQRLIPELNLAEAKEKRLQASLLKFLNELEMPKSRFSIGSGHLVAALTIVNLAVLTTAAAPEALEALSKVQTIWGEENSRAEAEYLRIPYQEPVGLLEAPVERKQIPHFNGETP